MYLVSVYFDEKTNKILQGYIDKIALATNNDFMVKNSVPPHMTVSAIEARDVDVLIDSFNTLEKTVTQGTILFASVGQLLPYVFYATPVLNEYLLTLSKQVYDAFKDIPDTTVSKYYRPLSWLPHVTLGKTLDRLQMQRAFEIMQDRFSPFEATVVEIGLAKTNPHDDVVRFTFK